MKGGSPRLSGGWIVLVLLLLACGCTQGGDRDVLFQDVFDNPRSGWGADQRERFERGYAEGEYFIQLYGPDWFAWAYPGKRFDDAGIEVDAYLAAGSPDSHFGIVCRHVDLGNFYYFAISADGYYGIFRRVDSGDLEILTGDGQGMVPSPAVRTGNQVNHLLAVCQGDELALYVNGELVGVATDSAFGEGDVGIGAGSGPEGAVLVRFDNFAVTGP